VLSYSLALAEELRPHGITVTALCPGVTDTEIFERGNLDQSGLTAKSMATAEEVARAGYEALLAGEVIEVPTLNTTLLWHLTRLLPRTRVTKLSGDYWAPE
jgi:hypothetical protein